MPSLLLASLLTATGAAAAPDDTWMPVSGAIHAAPGTTTTLNYCAPGGMPLAMDLSEPVAGASRPVPAVLYIHGGGGALGDRQAHGPGASLAGQDGALFGRVREQLRNRGFVVASIDYRLLPLHPWPAQVEDAKCAVRFLRAHAGVLGVDPARIGAWGSSEGGYLSAMLGTAGPAAGFDVGQYSDQSSRVQAVVDMFGPTDFTQTSDSNGFVRLILSMTYGGDRGKERRASPITYVERGDPPFLILHGTDDQEIPPHHSRELAGRLLRAGVPTTLVLVEGAGHNLATPGERPGPNALADQVVGFLTAEELGG